MKKLKFTNEDISAFALGLAHLCRSGIATGDALALMAEDEPNEAYGRLLREMSRKADEGQSLSQLVKEAYCFPHNMCALLSVAESVGKTEETLFSLAEYYEKRSRLEREMKNSLRYPMVLLAALVLVVVALILWVMPVFADVYADLGAEPGGAAAFLLGMGAALRRYWPIFVLVCAAGAVLLRRSLFGADRDKGAWALVNEAGFASALALAMSGGLDHSSAAAMAAGLGEKGTAFSQRCEKCLSLMDGGTSLPYALAESGLLSRARCRLLEAGIRSGSGEQVMAGIADSLAAESRQALADRLGIIEPVLVAVMSLLVGGILLGVMLPLMNIMNAIG